MKYFHTDDMEKRVNEKRKVGELVNQMLTNDNEGDAFIAECSGDFGEKSTAEVQRCDDDVQPVAGCSSTSGKNSFRLICSKN